MQINLGWDYEKLLWLIYIVVAKSEQLKINDFHAFHLIRTYIQLFLIIVSIHTGHYYLESKHCIGSVLPPHMHDLN